MRKTIFSGVIAAFALLFSIPALALTPGAGNYTFEWVGNCVDCAQVANTPSFEVRARLQLQNYTLGTVFVGSNLVQFDYFGSNLVAAYSVIPGVDDGSSFGGGYGFEGKIDSAAGPYHEVRVYRAIAPTQLSVQNGWATTYRSFNTTTSGGFNISIYGIFSEDFGTGTWSPAVSVVPEAESWAMMLFGLGAIGVAMRWRGQYNSRGSGR